MVGLIDIVPLVERVTIRGNIELEIRGIELTQLGRLVWQFPEFRRLWETRRIDAETVLALGTPLIVSLITAACAELNEMSARNLAAGEQAEIVARILKVTMPTGIGPFVEIMGALGPPGPPGAPLDVAALVTNSGTPSPSSEPTVTTMQ